MNKIETIKMETKKKLQLTKEWSPVWKKFRLYLKYGEDVITSYDMSDIEEATEAFENYDPENKPEIIAEREV